MEQMGGQLLRCIGLDRATFQLTGKAATYSLRRLCSLKACGVVAFSERVHDLLLSLRTSGDAYEEIPQ